MPEKDRFGCREILPIIVKGMLRSKSVRIALAIEVAAFSGLAYAVHRYLEISSTPKRHDPCLDAKNFTLSICSTEKTAEILGLPLLRELSQDADVKIKPAIDNVLDTIQEMVNQNRITIFEFNEPNRRQGIAAYGTLINGKPFFDMVLPQDGLVAADILGIKMHEAHHIAGAEQRRKAGKKSPFSPDDDKLSEYQAEFIGDYITYLARKKGLSSSSRQLEISKSGIDLPDTTAFLLTKGYSPESNLYQCLYEMSIRYIWKGNQGLVERILSHFLLPENVKKEMAIIEKRCLSPHQFAPKGGKEWEMLLQIKQKGLMAPDFIPGLPKINPPPKPESHILPHRSSGERYGLGTTKGIRL